MIEKKSIFEEAMLDVKNIQSALNTNTKEIFRSVAKEEIDSLVKESLLDEEDDYNEEDLESTDEPTDLDDDADTAEPTNMMGDEDETEDDVLGDIENSEEVNPEMDLENGMDSLELDTEPMDMTTASDDDIIAIYKKLSGDDQIEIVGDEIHLNISEPGEYVVKTNDSLTDTDEVGIEDETSTDEPMELEPMDGEEESGIDYEIEMDDEDVDTEDEKSTDEPTDLEPIEDEDEEEIDETMVATTNSLNEATSKKLVLEATKKYNNLLVETTKLKTENEEFRKALKLFRGQLLETVVFNSNLTYTTRLFMEHSTTKAEKENIIKRFDSQVSTLKESRNLYKTIVGELGTRKTVTESLEAKLSKNVTSGVSQKLNENTAYIDPTTKRQFELMGIKQ